MLWRNIDGLLISLSSETIETKHIQQLINDGVPVVLSDRASDTLNTHTVTSDNIGGSQAAVRHLLEEGFKRIGHVTSSAP